MQRLVRFWLAPALAYALRTPFPADVDVRLICSDVDGTLLTPSHEPTLRTVQTCLQAMEYADFATCTGRGRAGALKALGPLGDVLRHRGAPGVFLNGLLVYGPDGEEVVSETTLPADVVRAVAAFSEAHDATVVGFSGDRIVCDQPSEWSDVFATINEPTPEALGQWTSIAASQKLHKLIVLAEPQRHTELLRPRLTEALDGAAELTMAIPTMLEILPKGGSKGAGVRRLLERLEVDPEDVMALGDAENDIGMLELAGLAVAMGNAPPPVQEVAHFVSESNLPGEDGAAHAIERFFVAPILTGLPPGFQF